MKETKSTTELSYDDLPEEVDIVGISFRTAGKIYYFASKGIICREGEHAIVETTRGAEYGIVAISNHLVPKKELILPLRSVIRVATEEDDRRFEANARREEEAFAIAVKKIADHELDMKLVDVEYTFDNSKLLFYFTADDRVDFRELVKDLASVFRTRIELRQIGIRDEAKMMGGLGICGREYCCHSFLGDFAQVTIKMAKEQNLSLNAAKISGACGKLMCCLRYEHESYQQEIALTPKVDAQVTTPDGPGVVVSTDPLRGICTVRLNRTTDGTTTSYHRDLLNRPENPTEDIVRLAPHSTERGQQNANIKNDPLAKHESVDRTTKKNEDKDSSEKASRTERSETEQRPNPSEDRPNNRYNNRGRGGDRNKKRGEQRTPEEKRNANTQASPKGSSERRDRVQNRSSHASPNEKKSESKFDVRFGGGQLTPEPRGNEGKVGAGNRSSADGRTDNRRGERNTEKKSDKKAQKTENNN